MTRCLLSRALQGEPAVNTGNFLNDEALATAGSARDLAGTDEFYEKCLSCCCD